MESFKTRKSGGWKPGLLSNPRVFKKSSKQKCTQCKYHTCLLTSLEVMKGLLWIPIWATKMLT